MSAPAFRITAILFLILACGCGRFAVADDELDSVMYEDPHVEFPPPVPVFPEKLKQLWLEALTHPEADLKRDVARAIVQAQRLGLPGLRETAGPLTRELQTPQQHPLVRLAIARTLVALDARESADALFRQLDAGGFTMALLVEPALAKWDFQPARALWLTRLKQRPFASRELSLLAIRGLGTAGESAAAEPLLSLVNAQEASSAIRLEAARNLARVQGDGLLDKARQLASDESRQGMFERLVAASMLAGHRGTDVESLLLALAVDSEPAVAAVALARLLEIDPTLVLPIIETTIASADANVRHLGARAMAARPSGTNVTHLGTMLDDRHPDVRAFVRRTLQTFATESKLRAEVIAAATGMLASDKWRGLEQSLRLLTELDHKPAVDRMVTLLDFERPEVFVAAAWGLRRLAVPRTLEAMFEKAQRETDATVAPPHGDSVDLQLSQLFQAFGQMKYTRSDSLLRRHVPKSAVMLEARAAAVWSLGYLHAGKPDAQLTTQFAARLSDTNPFDPEDERVRRMAAVSLGRMKAKDGLPALEKFYKEETPNSLIGYSCRWSIHEITGTELPGPVAMIKSHSNWFLVPTGANPAK